VPTCTRFSMSPKKIKCTNSRTAARHPAVQRSHTIMPAGTSRIPRTGHSVRDAAWDPGCDVPAAVWGWDEVVRHFGKLSLKEDLTPAIEYAEQGFPIQEGDAASWSLPNSVDCHRETQRRASTYQPFCNSQDPDSIRCLYPNGVKPVAGQIFKNPDMAHTLRLISDYGREVFYKGEIGPAIVAKSNQLGGTMTLSDLANYKGEWVTPAHGTITALTSTATTAPSQSWASIEELNILEACVPGWTGGKSLAQLGPTNPLYWHLIIEAKKWPMRTSTPTMATRTS